ncbi:alpha/beta hydrolase [Streptomyces sp. NPDC046831]|uniref:alpha/beta hydrolase n=1 Tax=Streptomyces sp. NPDC046831 TaxID=3154805 RepID=UPI0033F045B0
MPSMLSVRPAVRRCACAGALTLALLGAGLPASAADGDGPGLHRFYSQRVTWASCGADRPRDLQCGKVTVPLDYARPGSGTLELALARYRASGPSRGSVVLNFGGPGGAGVPALAAGGREFMDLTNGYDVVAFDPRGVGQSSPVSCGTGSALYEVLSADDAAAGDPQAALERWRRAAAECAAHAGAVLRHIGTVDSARDLDVIRQALGDKKLNYLGFSYGTRLGAVYAAEFPDKVGRMALDGVDTLTEPLAEQGRVAAEGQQAAFDAFLHWCVRDLACPFGDDRRTARARVLRLVRSLDRDPVPMVFGGELSGQALVGAISQALYSKRLWPLLEHAVASLVEDGDTRRIEAFTSGGVTLPGRRGPAPKAHGVLVDPEDVPPDNLAAAMMAINCADDPDRPGADRIGRDLARLRTEYEQASPVFGRFRLNGLLMCYGRPKGTDFVRERVKNLEVPKMLLVGTRGDPATPYRWTVETAKRLGSSTVVLDNRGQGHTGYGSSKCVHRKVDDFLLYGSLPPSGSSCPADPEPDAGD